MKFSVIMEETMEILGGQSCSLLITIMEITATNQFKASIKDSLVKEICVEEAAKGTRVKDQVALVVLALITTEDQPTAMVDQDHIWVVQATEVSVASALITTEDQPTAMVDQDHIWVPVASAIITTQGQTMAAVLERRAEDLDQTMEFMAIIKDNLVKEIHAMEVLVVTEAHQDMAKAVKVLFMTSLTKSEK
jgi:hypothetical protein